jgi:hypothetical protein
MAKQIKIEVDTNLEPTINNLKALKKQLKETAAGTAEFNRLSAAIRDMDDAIKDASKSSDDFAGFLENASGPLGAVGKGIRQAEQVFSSFNGALKASVIGIVVAAIGGLVGAFAKTEGAMKKLEPIMIGIEKIFGGIFKALEPLIDSFMDLAIKALPYVTKGVGIFYSSLVALFTYVKEAGSGYAKVIKGIFTMNGDLIKEGAEQMKNSFSKTAEAYNESMKRFEDGTKMQTKIEKDNLAERNKAHEDYLKRKEEKEKEAWEEEKALVDAQLKEYERLANKRKKLIAEVVQYNSLANQVMAGKKEEEDKIAAAKRTADAIKYLKINSEEEVLAWSKNNQTTALAEEAKAKQQSVVAMAGLEAWLVSDKKAKLDEGVEAAEEALNLISAIVDRDSAAGKAIAVAQAIINTYQGATKALAQGGVLGPAMAAVTVAAGLVNVKKILSTKVPSASGKGSVSGGGDSMPSVSNIGTSTLPAPTIGGTVTNPNQQLAGMIGNNINQNQAPVKAYVLQSDVKTADQFNRRILQASKLG